MAERGSSVDATMPPTQPRADLATSRLHLRVRFCETDLMGIVHHASYLAYFEAARVAWLRRRGVTYATWAARGWHLPVVEASVKYRAPARFEDVLAIDTTLAELRSHSLRFSYIVQRDGERLAEGETRLACVDAAHKLQRLPEDVAHVLASGEAHADVDALC
jgi:acyl-CoA thioester hydrolase